MERSLLFFLLVGVLSCKGLFQYSPNEIRLEDSEKNLNAKNIQKIQSLVNGDSVKFILIGDSQRFYDEVEEFVSEVNQLQNIAFVVLAGDITDYGLNKEFQWINRSLSKLRIPYVAVIGNHDMLANGRFVYKEMFGPENFSFSYNKNKFICLNSNSLEVGYNGSLPDISWLTHQLSDLANYNHAFVISHIPPFDVAFDKKLEQSYVSLLAASKKVKLSMHGHQHRYQLSEPYGDGIKYLVIGSQNKRNYAIVTVWNDQYKIEEIYY
ncbi:MAG: metallophosphoesterase [Chitinophagaceae bacterium]